MKCPNCGAKNKNGNKYCEECGAKLVSDEMREKSLQMAGNAGVMLGAAARQMRLEADYSDDTVIPERKFNAIMIGVVLWGLVINVFLCKTVGDVYAYINPVLFMVLYLVLAIGGTIIAAKSDDPLVSFLGYNMIVVPFGLVISTLVEGYGGLDSAIVTNAFVYTMLISFGMLGMALAFPQLFAKLGGALLSCLIGVIICELLLLLFRVRQTFTDWIVAGIFSFYIGYDIYRSQQFVKTVDNAVDCALDIYLDMANLFVRILRIMARSRERD